MSGHDCDVLIVGGGPTGVTLGLLLAQRGVSVIVAEKEADIYPLPRAAHIDHEGMRILQSAGVADAVMATSRQTARYDFLNADGDILLRFDGSDRIGPGGWPGANMIHQPSVESALRSRLADLPSVALHSRWNFNALTETGSGVAALFDTPEGQRTVAARYLVGADGARSPVRTAADIGFDDLDFDEPWLVIDTIVRDPERLPKVNLQICDPARPTTCVLMGEGRHRWEFMIKPGETPETLLDDAFIARLLEPWDIGGAVTLERKAVYRFNARIATLWRRGRVLLAGDAAHQMPPFAGQGLCSGLRDAANLAWKLAAVVQDKASDTLLDTYQPEREPNVRGIIAMAIMMGRTVCITDPEAAEARDRQMLAARKSGQAPDGAISYPPVAAGCILAGAPAAGGYFPQPPGTGGRAPRFDAAMGPGPWLIARGATPATPVRDLHSVVLGDLALAPYEPALVSWLDQNRADAVLVRPDFHVFGTGSADALASAWQAALR